MYAVGLRSAGFVISVGSFRGLVEVVLVRAITKDGAAAGIGGPGNYCPTVTRAFDPRTVDDLQSLRALLIFVSISVLVFVFGLRKTGAAHCECNRQQQTAFYGFHMGLSPVFRRRSWISSEVGCP